MKTYDWQQQALCLLMDGLPVLALEGGNVLDPGAPYEVAFLAIDNAMRAHVGAEQSLRDSVDCCIDDIQHWRNKEQWWRVVRCATELEGLTRALRLLGKHKFTVGPALCGFDHTD